MFLQVANSQSSVNDDVLCSPLSKDIVVIRESRSHAECVHGPLMWFMMSSGSYCLGFEPGNVSCVITQFVLQAR